MPSPTYRQTGLICYVEWAFIYTLIHSMGFYDLNVKKKKMCPVTQTLTQIDKQIDYFSHPDSDTQMPTYPTDRDTLLKERTHRLTHTHRLTPLHIESHTHRGSHVARYRVNDTHSRDNISRCFL